MSSVYHEQIESDIYDTTKFVGIRYSELTEI